MEVMHIISKDSFMNILEKTSIYKDTYINKGQIHIDLQHSGQYKQPK
jgi:hypothetical protein